MATAMAIKPPFASRLSENVGRDAPVERQQKRHDVSTFINYYKDPGDGSPPMPIRISDKTVKNERPTVAYPTVVRDITGEEGRYTLDEHGFQHHRRGSSLAGPDFHDKDLVEKVYYPECEQLLKDVTGAPRVFVFDHKTRFGPSDWHRRGENNRAARGPLLRAHVDQSYEGAGIVLRRWFPGEAGAEKGVGDEEEEGGGAGLPGRRWQIINEGPTSSL